MDLMYIKLARIGYHGKDGLDRAKAEIARREKDMTEDKDYKSQFIGKLLVNRELKKLDESQIKHPTMDPDQLKTDLKYHKQQREWQHDRIKHHSKGLEVALKNGDEEGIRHHIMNMRGHATALEDSNREVREIHHALGRISSK